MPKIHKFGGKNEAKDGSINITLSALAGSSKGDRQVTTNAQLILDKVFRKESNNSM